MVQLIIALRRSHKDSNKRLRPTVNLTWHVSQIKVHNLHKRYILKMTKPLSTCVMNPLTVQQLALQRIVLLIAFI